MSSNKSSSSKPRITTKKVLLTSFVVDIIDIVLNLIIVFLSGSVVMLTQVLEGIADLVSSGFLLIGLRRSMQKEDRAHPFGYGREIYFWTLLAALVMFGLTSTLSFYFGYERFLHPEPVHNVFLALLILFVTIFTNSYALYLSYQRLIRKRHPKHIIQVFQRSPLVETKTAVILDLMGTLASIFGIVSLGIYAKTGDLHFDGLGAMVIGVMMGVLSLFLIGGIWDLLVGKSASSYTEKKIKNAALKVPEVEAILGIKTLYIGAEKLLVHIDVHMRDGLTTDQIEKLIDKIKAKIRREEPTVRHIQVELETP